MTGDGGELLAHPMLLCFPIRRLLRNLDVERNSFSSLTVAEMDGGKLAMQRRLGRSSMAVGTSFGGATAVKLAPAAAERLGEPPSGLGAASFELARRQWLGLETGCGNGEKCWGEVLGAPICRPKSPPRAVHRPGDLLQPNQRFVTRLLRIWGKSRDRFRWG
jgi:hypothetical protein